MLYGLLTKLHLPVNSLDWVSWLKWGSTGSCFKMAYFTKTFESFKTSSTNIGTRSRVAYQFFSDNVVWCNIGDTCIDMSSCTNLSSYCLLVYLDSSVNKNYYCIKNEHRTILYWDGTWIVFVNCKWASYQLILIVISNHVKTMHRKYSWWRWN